VVVEGGGREVKTMGRGWAMSKQTSCFAKSAGKKNCARPWF